MFSKAKHKDHTEEAMKIYEEARSSLTRLQFIDNFPSYLGYQLEPMSMEQLWLAFVMKKKYDKQWTGNEWEVINELS